MMESCGSRRRISRQHLDAVAVRKADVEQHQVEGMIFELLKAGRAGFGESYVEAFRSQKRFEPFADFGFVVYNENGALRHGLLFWRQEIPAGKTCPFQALNERPPFLHAP